MSIQVIIGCGKRKHPIPAPAADMYLSQLFTSARQWCEEGGMPWRIMSAQHGILDPDSSIEPYDLALSMLNSDELAEYRDRIAFQWSTGFASRPTRVVLLASSLYARTFAKAISGQESVEEPLAGLGFGRRIHWLQKTLGSQESALDMERTYSELRRLSGGPLTADRLPTLAEYMRGRTIPQKGVYFFFDDDEPRYGRRDLRIVRIGTHGVSRGSKSTLRDRLRTHHGTTSGSGSHRSSIFRLHLGAAMLATGFTTSPQVRESWGSGSGHSASADVRAMESELEAAVSMKLGKLRIVCLPVNDESSAESDRALIEAGAIGVLARAGSVVDPPSPGWLGHHAQSEKIRNSGLWNISQVGKPTPNQYIQVLTSYVDRALSGDDAPSRTIATAGWSRDRSDYRLF